MAEAHKLENVYRQINIGARIWRS